MTKRRRLKRKAIKQLTKGKRLRVIKKFNISAYIHKNCEAEKSNQRDIALLEHGWAPTETKFGEPFKGKNKILIVE